MSDSNRGNADKPTPHETPEIHIDRKRYEAPASALSGTQLRSLADPDVGADRDLWQEIPGGDDNLVDANEVIELRNGMHFYSAPASINPG